jgi:hypothetical protein
MNIGCRTARGEESIVAVQCSQQREMRMMIRDLFATGKRQRGEACRERLIPPAT